MTDEQRAPSWRAVVYVGWQAAAKRTCRCLGTVAGRPILWHLVRRLRRGLRQPVSVIHHEDATTARVIAALVGSDAVPFTAKSYGMMNALAEFAAHEPDVVGLAVFGDTALFPDCVASARMIDGHLRADADCTIAPAHPMGLLPIVLHARALDLLAPSDISRPDWGDPFVRAAELLAAPESARARTSERRISRFVDEELSALPLPSRLFVSDRRMREAASAVLESRDGHTLDAGAAMLFKENVSRVLRRRLEVSDVARPANGRRRVLMATARDAFAGGEVSFFELMRYLRGSASYEPVVLAQTECVLAEKARELGVAVHIADFNLFEMGPHAIQFCADLVARQHIAIAHLDNHIPAALCPPLVLAAKARGVPVVSHARLYVPSSAVLPEITQNYDRVIAPSQFIAQSLLRTFLGPDRVAQIYDGIDLASLDPGRYNRASLRQELGIDAEAQVLTMVAAITAQKRQDLLIEAASRLIPSHPRVVTLLVGEPDSVERPYVHTLLQRISSLGMRERVILRGYHPFIPHVYAVSDVVVMCMPEEGWGRSTVEAMAMEVPVVVPNAGGARELVRGEGDGLAFEPDNVDDLTEKLRMAIDDDVLRRRMSAAGAAIASAYSVASHGKAIEALYDELLAAHFVDTTAAVGLVHASWGDGPPRADPTRPKERTR